MTLSPLTLAVAAATGLASGTHAAIWGSYKDAIHEGFRPPRFARSVVVGAAAGVVLQARLALPLPAANALVVLFGLAYAAERGIVEVWKTFVRCEDQSKYFIPMQFTIRGAPVGRGARLAAGAGYVAMLALGLIAIARMDAAVEGSLRREVTAIAGLAVGLVIALGGAWKDAPKEGFEPLKFFRSPAMTVAWAVLLSGLADSVLQAAVGAIGFERATAETYKTFCFPSRPRGKFAGKPILFPEMLAHRRWLVPAYVAIWAAVLGATTLALHDAAARVTLSRNPIVEVGS